MKSNYRKIIALLAALALLGAACGSDAASTDTTTAESGAAEGGAEFTVAVVAPSAANDLAFTQSMHDALERLKADGTISDFVISENMFVVEDAGAALRGYAEDGFDLVIGHGSQYGSLLQEIAPDFPETAFVWGTAADTFGEPNISSYSAAADQGGYVLGTMAALLSTSGQIGIVGPLEVGDAKLYIDGFKAGAEATTPGIAVNVNYIESFSDTALAAEAATAFIGAGADVLTGSAQMTAGAIGVAGNADVLWFGTQSAQTQLAPDVVVANQVYHWEGILTDLIGNISSGTMGGQSYDLTLENGGLVIEYNDGYELPADVKAAAEAAIAGISDGSVSSMGG